VSYFIFVVLQMILEPWSDLMNFAAKTTGANAWMDWTYEVSQQQQVFVGFMGVVAGF
jgi:hypothetical protein